ncbi:phospholipid/cholesterol/gamma-HCH transport system ATP-binding protein [Chitinophaga ginsengisegetis]|uniref:Phospholipid/cholesterol/gamma-HCH transport system ATP-binding protein n=1 Tax=Chitinophaga ginsengisegetis TaxID=393003 RepID=A0A1T5P934_9BACT|nr:ATP-binding cassette domain-containing protein [Chitinophaga ginsengisegetis]MDR6570865.1 phospholipid/cholesterol/gamma-HCH transport system ATP-binding protein [Chitinophaga ginsengisegetis]MDR6650599.1 phospholipid/cholesterol/gamma-HCH transport system ATP-binding protein [Chitinophaga ginsengisegetis]MDR6656762.1 phospholipid/cholesterol/gamma-HCH transport system ATP-binding protein [Chitinophaga ginsengisegetis]SKD09182.1 phospholipid/cholesterol/gamma-HCH transport system ATP-binding
MKTNGHQIDMNETVISIRNLYKSFGQKHVLQGIDLDLHKGENVVVLGRSGTGKSVLIKIIIGLLKPDAGTVNVLGEEVDQLKDAALRALRLKVGFSFQSSALYDSMTVGENLAFPLKRNQRDMTKDQIRKTIDIVLEAIGLPETINQMPSELSGGQKKRIGIGRTLILRPEIMLYDEPTAGLDPITSMELNKLIIAVQERFNTSSIIITHDLTCAKEVGDRVAVMDEGKFIRQGSFEEVFNEKEGLIKSFYDYNFIQ